MGVVTTAEQLTQNALDVGVIDHRDLQTVWGELGTREVSLSAFSQALLRRNLLTQFQLERLMRGLKAGYFYGDYKVLYCVGAGTFARVFRAAHRETNQLFAVKVLRSRFSNEVESADAFRREGELGRALQHPNIVPIHEVVSKRDVHYIVMDFIEGRNLREFARVRGKFRPLEAAQIMDGMVAGLNYAFQQGVTHRDLKMSNVLVSSDGVAKLVDFGLAALESDGTGEGANKRTVEYAALERATNVRKDDTRSDIFFAGCIFYHMLSGIAPLPEGRDRANKLNRSTFSNIAPILTHVPDVPPMLAKIIHRATELDPAKRYQTPVEMLADLKIASKRLAQQGSGGRPTQREFTSQEGLDPHGEPRRLMVVESNVKMQDIFRELFKRNGYRVLVASDPQRALDRFYADAATAEIVLFSSGHIGRAALEAFNHFGQHPTTREIPAVLLLDEQHRSWTAEGQQTAHRAVACMPIKPKALRQIMLHALGAKTAEKDSQVGL